MAGNKIVNRAEHERDVRSLQRQIDAIKNRMSIGAEGAGGGTVVDSDFSITPNSGDANTDTLIDKIRDALITCGLIDIP